MADQILLKEFGKRIRQLRTERNLSQEELSELTDFHRTYIGMVERDEEFLKSFFQSNFVTSFAFPNNQVWPSICAVFWKISRISFDGSHPLFLPIVSVGLRRDISAFAIMHMPETAVNEDDFSVPC